jgi:hypothetical protein
MDEIPGEQPPEDSEQLKSSTDVEERRPCLFCLGKSSTVPQILWFIDVVNAKNVIY